MTDNQTPQGDEQLAQVGWWCWRGDNHGHLATAPCRSDNVPIHVPVEWAGEMREVIQRIEDGDGEDGPAASAVVAVAAPPTGQTAEAAAPVKQRADCTELEWAEQERARFERLYTRETVRVDQAVQRAEAMERAMESTAADALAHRGCHRDLMGQCLRAERAEAEAEQLRAGRAAVLLEAAQHLYTALFPAVYADMGQKAAEGVNRAVSELRRMADEAQQQPETQAALKRAHVALAEQAGCDQAALARVERLALTFEVSGNEFIAEQIRAVVSAVPPQPEEKRRG